MIVCHTAFGSVLDRVYEGGVRGLGAVGRSTRVCVSALADARPTAKPPDSTFSGHGPLSGSAAPCSGLHREGRVGKVMSFIVGRCFQGNGSQAHFFILLCVYLLYSPQGTENQKIVVNFEMRD